MTTTKTTQKNEQTSPEVASAAAMLMHLDINDLATQELWPDLLKKIKAVAASALTQAPDKDQEQLAESGGGLQTPIFSLLGSVELALEPEKSAEAVCNEVCRLLQSFADQLSLEADITVEYPISRNLRAQAEAIRTAVHIVGQYPVVWANATTKEGTEP